MLATNHALSGAVIGSLLPLPVAVPVAFASHFVLDSLPHYGIPAHQRNKSHTYHLILIADVVVSLTGATALALLHKWRMETCAWVAWFPDLFWVIYYLSHNKTLRIRPRNPLLRFHQAIQRYERPWGIAVELIFFVTLLPVFIIQALR